MSKEMYVKVSELTQEQRELLFDTYASPVGTNKWSYCNNHRSDVQNVSWRIYDGKIVGYCREQYYIDEGIPEISVQELDTLNVLELKVQQYFLIKMKNEKYQEYWVVVSPNFEGVLECVSDNKWKDKSWAQSEIDYLLSCKEGKINV